MKRKLTLGITLLLVLATACQLKAQTGLSDYTSYFLSKDVPYDFTDAVNYKGNVYILQTYLSRGFLRVIKTKRDADNKLVIDKHTQGSGISAIPYVTLKGVEWRGRFLIFYTWGSNYSIGVEEYLEEENELSGVGLPGSFCYDACDENIAATVMGDYLYLFYKEKGSEKIRVRRTADDKLWEWEDRGYVMNGTQDNIKFSKLGYGMDETFDAVTWHGMVNGEYGSKIIFGRVHHGILTAFTYDGSKWEEIVESASNHQTPAFNLKLVQGSVSGSAGSDKNAVLFTYAVKNTKIQGEIRGEEYWPEERKFSGKEYTTNIAYGCFGMACDYVEQTDGNVRQYIYIFKGNEGGKHKPEMYTARIGSNLIKRSVYDFDCTQYFKDPKMKDQIRPLCTLYGFIEGAPPTLVNTQEWFDNCWNMFRITPSTIRWMSGSSDAVSTSETGFTDVSLNFGKKKGEGDKAGGTAGIQYAFRHEDIHAQAINTEKEFSFDNNSLKTQSTGYQVISVPLFRRTDLETLSPSGKAIKGAPAASVIIERSSVIRLEPIDLKEKPFGITNPSDIYCWDRNVRGIFLDQDEQLASSYTEFDSGVTSVSSWNQNLTNTTTEEHTATVNVHLEVPFFEFNGSTGYIYNRTVSTTISNGLSFTLSNIPAGTLPANNPAHADGYTVYLRHIPGNSERAKTFYYPDLLEKGLMLEGETPWIFAWDVTGIYPYKSMGANPAAVETAGIEGFSVWSEPGRLLITAEPGTHLLVSDLAGRVCFDQVMGEDRAELRLPTGIYLLSDGKSTPRKAIVK